MLDKNKNYLITVSGTANSGKSTVLSLTIDKFIQNGAKVVSLLKDGSTDRVVILEYNNKLIGICTAGDAVSVLDWWLPRLLSKGCKHIVTATKAYGDTCSYVNNFAEDNNFEIISLHKFHHKNENDISKIDEFVFDLLK